MNFSKIDLWFDSSKRQVHGSRGLNGDAGICGFQLSSTTWQQRAQLEVRPCKETNFRRFREKLFDERRSAKVDSIA